MINMISSPLINAGCGADIHVIVKIESADSIPNLHSIITASDGVIT
jgi:pyruvate kinase